MRPAGHGRRRSGHHLGQLAQGHADPHPLAVWAHDELEGGVPDHQTVVMVEQGHRARHGVGRGAQTLQGAALADAGHQRHGRGGSQEHQGHGHHQGGGRGGGGGDRHRRAFAGRQGEAGHGQQMQPDDGGDHEQRSDRPSQPAGAQDSDPAADQREAEGGEHRGALHRQIPDQAARRHRPGDRREVDDDEAQGHQDRHAQT